MLSAARPFGSLLGASLRSLQGVLLLCVTIKFMSCSEVAAMHSLSHVLHVSERQHIVFKGRYMLDSCTSLCASVDKTGGRKQDAMLAGSNGPSAQHRSPKSKRPAQASPEDAGGHSGRKRARPHDNIGAPDRVHEGSRRRPDRSCSPRQAHPERTPGSSRKRERRKVRCLQLETAEGGYCRSSAFCFVQTTQRHASTINRQAGY